MITQNPLILYLLYSFQVCLIMMRYLYYYVWALPVRWLFRGAFSATVTPELLMMRFDVLVYEPFAELIESEMAMSNEITEILEYVSVQQRVDEMHDESIESITSSDEVDEGSVTVLHVAPIIIHSTDTLLSCVSANDSEMRSEMCMCNGKCASSHAADALIKTQPSTPSSTAGHQPRASSEDDGCGTATTIVVQSSSKVLPSIRRPKSVVQLVSADVRRGYSNSVQQLDVQAENFPQRAVVKSKTSSFVCELLGLTIREVKILRLLATKDPIHSTDPSTSGVQMPHVFYSAYHPITHEQVILMEDLTLRGYENLNIAEPQYCDNAHVARLIVTELARMHAKWLNSPWLPKRHPFMLQTDTYINLATQWCHSLWVKKLRPHFLDKPYIVELGDLCTLKNHTQILLARSRTLYPQSLSHADVNLTNLFWRRHDDAVCFADWSNAEYNLFLFDIQYLLSFNFSSQMAAAHEMELLRHYQSQLILELQRYGKVIPHAISNFDEMHRIYCEQMYFMFFAMLFVTFESGRKSNVEKIQYSVLMKERVCATLERCNTLEHVRLICGEDDG